MTNEEIQLKLIELANDLVKHFLPPDNMLGMESAEGEASRERLQNAYHFFHSMTTEAYTGELQPKKLATGSSQQNQTSTAHLSQAQAHSSTLSQSSWERARQSQMEFLNKLSKNEK